MQMYATAVPAIEKAHEIIAVSPDACCRREETDTSAYSGIKLASSALIFQAAEL
jgi:hypothetical protein